MPHFEDGKNEDINDSFNHSYFFYCNWILRVELYLGKILLVGIGLVI